MAHEEGLTTSYTRSECEARFPTEWDPVMDYVIKQIPTAENDHHVLAYADDLMPLADTPGELQHLLDTLSLTITSVGLRLNLRKYFSLHLGQNPRECKSTKFNTVCDEVPSLTDGNTKKFLGKPLGFNICKSEDSLGQTIDKGLCILNAALAPWQRLEELKSFYYPSLLFDLRTGKHQKTK